MNPAHLHLMVNHVPVFGTIFAALLIGWGLLRKSEDVLRLGLILAVLIGIATWGVQLTGEPAEHALAGTQGFQRRLARSERRRPAVENGVDRHQPPRLTIGGTAHHHGVHMGEVPRSLLQTGDTTVECHMEIRESALEAIDPLVVERRHLAVLLGRQAGEPGFASMNDQRVNA